MSFADLVSAHPLVGLTTWAMDSPMEPFVGFDGERYDSLGMSSHCFMASFLEMYGFPDCFSVR